MEKDYHYTEFYQTAREIIGNKTPLKANCGLICDKNCCKGDEETGMLLFPFEETVFNVAEKDGVRLCVCGGECDREKRPLSCVIFPFFPYMDEKGRVKAVIDVRGRGICPLVEFQDKVRFNKSFIRKVGQLGRYLKKDENCRQFLWGTSREIDKINLFIK